MNCQIPFYGKNASRRNIRDLNLSAANRHLFNVNMLLVTRMFGLGTQAQNTYAEPIEVRAEHIYIPVKMLSIHIYRNNKG